MIVNSGKLWEQTWAAIQNRSLVGGGRAYEHSWRWYSKETDYKVPYKRSFQNRNEVIVSKMEIELQTEVDANMGRDAEPVCDLEVAESKAGGN